MVHYIYSVQWSNYNGGKTGNTPNQNNSLRIYFLKEFYYSYCDKSKICYKKIGTIKCAVYYVKCIDNAVGLERKRYPVTSTLETNRQ